MQRKSETDLLHIFIERVPHHVPYARVFRRNIINRVVDIEGRKVQLRNGIEGQSDAFAILRGGLHIEIETKAAKGRMADAQRAWRDWCETWRIPHLVLRARRDEGPGETVERWLAEFLEKVASC